MNEREWLKTNLAICALCGRCKKDCPTYLAEHNESRSPRGRMLLLYEAALKEELIDQALIERVYSCLVCGACEGICPSGVDVLKAILIGRAYLKGHDRKGRLLRRLMAAGTKRPILSYRLLSVFKDLLNPLLVKKGLIHRGLELDMPPLQTVDTVFSPEGRRKGRVVLFTGCSVRFLYPYLGQSFISVMNSLGFEVVLQRKEYCCGAPLLGLGMIKETERLAQRNLESFERLKADAIVSLCPTCVTVTGGIYRRLFGDALEMMVFDDFIKDLIGEKQKAGLDSSVFYHPPCHMKNYRGCDSAIGLIELSGMVLRGQSEGCCGHAGTYSLRFKERSLQMLQKRVSEFESSEADVLVTSCPGCMFQLSKMIDHPRVIHTVEIVEEMLEIKGKETD